MLRTFLSVLLVCLVTFGLLINDAEARRFGGGRSFGFSRSTSSFSRPAPAFGQNYSNAQRPFGQAAAQGNRWFGPLAGLLTGGLLASLFMGNGIGSGILSWLLVGGLMLVAFTIIRSKMQPAPQYRQDHGYRDNFARDAAAQFMRNSHAHNNNHGQYNDHARNNNLPVGFDSTAFLRDAKVQFIRLQAAYDQKNLNDIREFTTPEVFAEIQMQLQERGDELNKTNVITLNADLLDVETDSQLVAGAEMQTMVASVRFSGQIQENPNEAAALVNEIWHFRKEIASPRWLVAGVQQN